MKPLFLIAAVSAVAAMAGCATYRPQAAAPAPELIPSDVSESGRMDGIVINRRYGDFFIIDGEEVRREVEFAWDYDRGTGFRRIYDLQGNLLETEDLSGTDFSLTEPEKERVRDLVRGYPTLKDAVNRPGVVIWAGGFAMRKAGDRYCGAGTRCIHAIVSADNGYTAVAHAIVDLQRDRVVYPAYDLEPLAKKPKPQVGN